MLDILNNQKILKLLLFFLIYVTLMIIEITMILILPKLHQGLNMTKIELLDQNLIKKLNICTKPPKFPPTSIKLKTFLVALIYYDDSYMLYLKRVC